MNVYFDNAATTKLDSSILDKMLPFMVEGYGNPSSIHKKGREVKSAVEKSRSKIADILNCEPGEIFFTSGGTEADNMFILNTVYEKNINTICIPFYADNNETLGKITITFFKEKKIPISQQAINLLVERCRGNRQNLNNELIKIENFLITKKNINIEEILKLTNLAENYSISEVVDNCLSKNISKTNKFLNENNFSSEESILILRTFLSKAKRLLSMSKEYQSNENIDKTLASYKPPIFWKDKEIVKNQPSKWSLKDAEKLIYKIHDIELMVKKNYYNSLNIVSDFILNAAK